MPNKDFTLEDGLAVTVYKRRGNRNLRLSVAPSGKVRISIPSWAPYSAGLSFARSRQAWIREQHRTAAPLRHGQAIGKAHHLEFLPRTGITQPRGRVNQTAVVISYPAGNSVDDPAVQAAAERACLRALRRQSEQLLPQRLAVLAAANNFEYASVSIKHLKSRWGSCDQRANVVLNLFLMQLPWDLIDYVLLHELTHTRVLRHGPDFWQALAVVSPRATDLKRQLKEYQPMLSTIG